MTSRLSLAGILLVLILIGVAHTADNGDGFVPLFNGKDLTGWVPVNVAPGTFFVKDNEIVTTGKPTGFMRTEKQYENFICEFEWMHVPPKPDAVGNSGFFVWGDPLPAVGTPFTRGIEVQVLVNLEYKNNKGEVTATSHGDVFSIWGAKCVPDRPHPNKSERCLPSEYRAKGPGEWNHYRVEANDGVIKLQVNGKEVSGVSSCTPRKGYLALESEGSECHFRNLKIKELPSTNPKAGDIANVARGHTSLFDGLTLDGWKTGEESGKKAWTVRDGLLSYDVSNKPDAVLGSALETTKEFGDLELIADFRLPKPKAGQDMSEAQFVLRGITLAPSSEGHVVVAGPKMEDIELKEEPQVKAGEWNRVKAMIKDNRLTVTINGRTIVEMAEIKTKLPKGTVGIAGKGTAEFRNLFLLELK